MKHLIETEIAARILEADLKDKEASAGKEEKKNLSIREKLLDFFEKNPKPTDDEVHGMASEEGLDPHELEQEVYALLGSFISGSIFKHGNDSDDQFDPEQLKMGIEVEKEHLGNLAIAKAIAKAHLAELGDYYSRLKKMEKA